MKLIAHRGYSAQYPENTMVAFEKAYMHGAPMLELDITLTQDRRIVVIHDDTLDRTTSGSGLVSEHTLEEIQKLDAGSWFDAKHNDQKVPTLQEVLDQFGSEIAINIEIKKESVKLDEYESIERVLYSLLQQYPKLKDVQISSFEPLALYRMRKHHPGMQLCYLTKEKLSDEERKEMEYLDVIAQHLCIDDVDTQEVAQAKKLGVEIRAYTVKSKEDLQKAEKLGLDAVFINELDVSRL